MLQLNLTPLNFGFATSFV